MIYIMVEEIDNKTIQKAKANAESEEGGTEEEG